MNMNNQGNNYNNNPQQQMPNNYGNMNSNQQQYGQMPNNYGNMNPNQQQYGQMPSKVNFIVIVKWVLSIALTCWGLLNILSVTNNILYGLNTLLSLGAAALLCPLFEEKFRNIKYKWAIVIGLVVLEIIVYFIIGQSM